MELMKAARLHRVGEDLRLDLVEVPVVGPDEVLVKIHASGICHSDINYRDGVGKVGRLPVTLGHEIAGVVTEKGERVREIGIGDRVVIHYVMSCGQCRYCKSDRETYCEKYQMIGKDLDGGFAEYVKVPASNALRLPETIAFDHAAIMGCAVSTAFHALRRARARREDTIAIYGAGGLGVHAVQLSSRIIEASNIIAVDVVEEKLRHAKRLGARDVVNPNQEDVVERIREITDGLGADVVIDFVGRKRTVENALACAGKGGRVVLVGISLEELHISPYSTIIGKEIEMVGVNDHLKSELRQLIEFSSSGRIDLSTSVTNKVRLEDVNSGIQILEGNIGNPLRIVVAQ